MAGLFVVLTLAGCLPSSCQRTESQALFAADSLSRQLATQLTPDTLRLVWETTGPEGQELGYPRTLTFDERGHLYVGDTKRGSVYTFGEGGAFVDEVAWEGLAFPYLAGRRGDTLLVFDPDRSHLYFVVEGAPVRTLPTPTDLGRSALQYLAASGEDLFFKAVGEGLEGYLARLDEEGRISERRPLPGPYWRHTGLLRTWGDTLLSLSGYRPLIDVWVPGAGLDSMALQGFDSPMLSRMRAFMLGHEHEAPLLSTSAAPIGERLFVLNLRPGWLRLDVYDRQGVLRHVLVQEAPGFNPQFFPMDLAVRQRPGGLYEIAVAFVNPLPAVKLYHWRES